MSQQKEKNKRYNLPSALFKTLCIVALAFCLSLILAQPFSISTATLVSSNDRNDFEIGDFFHIVANSRHVRTLDPDVFIINIDNADRDQIVELVESVSLCEPSVIGLDVTFDQSRGEDRDQRLLEMVQQTPNLVLATTVKQDSLTRKFYYGDQSFFQQDLNDKEYAAVTFPTKYARSSIREFPVSFEMMDSTRLLSFASAIAQKHSPSAYAELLGRGNKRETINYPSREFRVLTPQQILDHADDLYGKVVLIGALHERDDEHVTPIKTMSGVEIHAHAISTILNGDYLTKFTKWQNWALAFVLCYIFVFLCINVKGDVKAMLLRLLQVLILYLLVRMGYYFFINHNLMIDFSYSFLMITFGLFAVNTWFGLIAIGKWIYSKLNTTKVMKLLSLTRRAMMVAIGVLATLSASAKYTVHSYDGKIIVESAGRIVPINSGMELRANDMVTIPEGGYIEIYNSFNSKIFKSTRPGRYGVSKIMIEAQMQANDAASNVNSRLRMSRDNASLQDVYIDNGKVTRALELYDPSAENLQIDCNTLARKLVSKMSQRADTLPLPIQIEVMDTVHGRAGFLVVNTFDFPIYFNVVKINTQDTSKIQLSELGQPAGSYVLKPGQSMSRTQMVPAYDGGTEVLLFTHYYFDIDNLLDSLQELQNDSLGDLPDDEVLPIYIKAL